MSDVERNWLIRTTQNQILGPVAKAKVLEFIQKGALGLSDEVSSGNGYWFHLREKDLVDKYLMGDVPQSYNPISEARTVLARKANPNKTVSINVASSSSNITQVINLKDLNFKAPNQDDLEYPDVTAIHKAINEDIKIPDKSDLEFPDILLSRNSQVDDTLTRTRSESKSKAISNVSDVDLSSSEEIKLPDNNDLEYPDSDFISQVKKQVHDDVEIKFTVPDIIPVTKAQSPKEKTSPVLELNSIKEEVKPLKMLARESQKILHERKPAKQVKKQSDEALPQMPKAPREINPELKNRNDSYLFIVLIFLVLAIIVIIFYYYRYILNKPLPV